MKAILNAMAATAWAMRLEYLTQVTGVVVSRHLHGAGDVVSQLQPGESAWINWKSSRARNVVALDNEMMGGEVQASKPPPYVKTGGIAIVSVIGSLHKYASWLDTTSFAEGVSYQQLEKNLRAAAADRDVRAIVLHIDSPGGQVDGLDQFASVIGQVRGAGGSGGKPVHAYVADLGASAAYWIASQCQSITVNPTGLVGSIGVYTLVMDTSKLHEIAGVKVHLVKDGKHKGAAAPGVPVSESDLVTIQEDVANFGKAFRAAVVRGRPNLKGSIDGLADGRTHMGDAAKSLGLVDKVQGWDAYLAALTARHSPRTEGARASDRGQSERADVGDEIVITL